MIVNLSAEVHCLQLHLQPQPMVEWKNPPFWQKKYSRYRIYIDDDLMTERDWAWDQNTYICEHMLAEISPDLTHTVRIDILNFNPGYQIQLGLGNLIVNDILQDNSNEYRNSLSFMLA
jgi:hypothetical protein